MPPPAAAIFSLLLILTGSAKLRRPNDTARALSSMSVPWPRLATAIVASGEVVVGTGALVVASPVFLIAQAGMYALFLTWVAVALIKDVPIASCGCLGREDTPPYWGHVILNAFAVPASAVAAISGGQVSVSGFLEMATLLLIVGVGAFLGWTVLDEGARISGLVTR